MSKVSRRTSRSALAWVGAFTFLAGGIAWGFEVAIHQDVTKQTVREISVPVGGESLQFSERALDQMSESNAAVDNWFFSAAYWNPDRHFMDEEFQDSSYRIASFRSRILESLRADPPDGDRARRLTGEVLHTIQDFYSHSNWVELGNTGINLSSLLDPPATLMACPNQSSMLGENGGGGLTSAYYVGDPRTGCGDLPHAGKCHHGNYTAACEGINKDRTDQNALFHPPARTLAEAATKDFLEDVLANIRGDDAAVRAYLDARGSVGFVIDDSGSMGAEIAAVRVAVSTLATAIDAIPALRPDKWVLVRFNDPGVGPVVVTDDIAQLRSAVAAIGASGGGDCPELSQQGLLAAIDRSSYGSRLFLFSDASAKDASLGATVIQRAQERGIRIYSVLTGSCSPIDPVYERVAAETGGQLFVLLPQEVAMVADLIEPQLAGDLVTVLSASGELAGSPRSFDVPVDGSLSRLVVSASLATKESVKLFRPSGEEILPSDPGVHVADLSTGCIVRIDDPAAGAWRLEIAGAGSYSIVADGNSPIDLHRFTFVAPNRDVHGGFMPIEGQPVAGPSGLGKAVLLGPFANAGFELVDESGATLGAIPLVRGAEGADPEHFLGSFPLPAVPFRVAATGTDAAGQPFRRQFPTVFRAQSVAVELDVDALESDLLPAGAAATVRFVVTNHGEAATFDLPAVENQGYLDGVSPASLTLDTGESATVEVSLDIPAAAPQGAPVDLTLSAARRDRPEIKNSATVHLAVQRAPEPPQVLTVFPAVAPPGARITVTGSGFTAGVIEVLFGTTPGLDVQVLDDSTLLVTVPDLPPGPVAITVTTTAGTAVLAVGPGGFSVAAPLAVIPTLSEWGLFAFIGALLAAAAVFLRRV